MDRQCSGLPPSAPSTNRDQLRADDLSPQHDQRNQGECVGLRCSYRRRCSFAFYVSGSSSSSSHYMSCGATCQFAPQRTAHVIVSISPLLLVPLTFFPFSLSSPSYAHVSRLAAIGVHTYRCSTEQTRLITRCRSDHGLDAMQYASHVARTLPLWLHTRRRCTVDGTPSVPINEAIRTPAT